MTVNEIEQKLLEYVNSEERYNHKENALKEFDRVREKFPLDDLIHIGFVIDDYPECDHFLFKVEGKELFFRFGLNREYLESLDKKDLHKVAKAVHRLFGKFKLEQ